MKERIVSSKTSLLLTLLLGVLFAFSVVSCKGKDPVVEDVDLVGTAWQGTVATKDTEGKLIEVAVSLSFLGNSVGRWYFEEDPAPFWSAWDEKKADPFPESERFSTFTYSRFSKKVLELREFRILYGLLISDWIITELTEKKFSLGSRIDTPSRTIWLRLKRIA